MTGGCVRVPRLQGEKAIKTLSSQGLYDSRRRALSREDYVMVPVTSVEEALDLLGREGVEASECQEELPPRKGVVDLSELKSLARELGLWRHSYHQVGDIIVFNAKGEEELGALQRLAEEFLKRLPHARSAYAKLETVGRERTPRLVHLAGERRTRTTVKEHGVLLAVDIERAYYNPRLAEEHHRIALETRDGDVVVDMFAGVGGFCLHAAVLRKAMVVCNDLNPHAVELIFEGVLLNLRKLRGWVHILKLDARELPQALRRVRADRVIMNHPTGSLDFLDTALKLARKDARVNLYLLAERGEDPLGLIPPEYAENVEPLGWREVLDYSPSKAIVRLDLRVLRPL